MLLKLFKNNRAGGILFIFLLALLIWVPLLTKTNYQQGAVDMPLYNLFFGNIHLYPVLSSLLAFLIIVLISVILFRMNIRFFLIQERSYMPAAFFLLIASANPAMHYITPVLIGALFLMIILSMLFGAYNAERNSLKFFNISLVLVTGIFFYGKLIWFIPLYWIILATIRSATWRELSYPVVAVLVALLFMFTWNVLSDNPAAWLGPVTENMFARGTWPEIPLSWMVFLLYLFLLIIVSSLFILQRFQVRKIYVRNFYQALFFTFAYGLLFFLLVSGKDAGCIYLVTIPFSYLLSNYFHTKKRRFSSEVLLWIFLLLLAWIHLDFFKLL